MSIQPTQSFPSKVVEITSLPKAKEAACRILETKKRNKDELLTDYLSNGKFMHELSRGHKSTKTYGLELKRLNPKICDAMDGPLRSNTKWLYAALHLPGSDAYGDLCETLGIENIFDYYTGNPTVIRRDYNEEKKKCS